MIIRRAFIFASAVVVTTAALTFGASSASASEDLFCNNTVGGPLDGTSVCIVQDELIEATWEVPYSAGSVCAAGQCTPATEGTVPVPTDVDEDPIEVKGTVCVPFFKGERLCQAFDTGGIY